LGWFCLIQSSFFWSQRKLMTQKRARLTERFFDARAPDGRTARVLLARHWAVSEGVELRSGLIALGTAPPAVLAIGASTGARLLGCSSRLGHDLRRSGGCDCRTALGLLAGRRTGRGVGGSRGAPSGTRWTCWPPRATCRPRRLAGHGVRGSQSLTLICRRARICGPGRRATRAGRLEAAGARGSQC
jgi:hypothetical protein